MPREVTDGDGTTWSCVEAYAGLSEDGKSDAARIEGTDRYRVVCTPSGGAASVTLELPGDRRGRPLRPRRGRVAAGRRACPGE
jgi:hypothetical protein